jgi:23S rRNA (guanosine2251-2'-O)-methyltransferase
MRKDPFKSRTFKTGQDRHKDFGRSGALAARPAGQGGALQVPANGRAQILYGMHAVTAAWLNPDRRCRHLYATAQALALFQKTLERSAALGLKRPQPMVVEREALDRLLPPGAVHQGLALDGEPLPEVNLDDVLIKAGNGPVTLVMLDQVTDPHNVGAILRSAAAFGCLGLIVQTRHAPDISGVMAKSASGAVDVVPILRETNLARTVTLLRETGFIAVGLDEAGETSLASVPLGPRILLALGAEGVGLRRLIAENCDTLAALPTAPPIASLNVSNAAAIGLYEIARRRSS